MRRTLLLVAATGVCLVAVEPRSATAQTLFACELAATPDGFVAIRATPSASGALVVRAKVNEVIEVFTDQRRKPVAKGAWWRVRHFPGEAMPEPSEPAFKDVREGWIHSRFIEGCDR
jgi:hypothetical protein